MEEEWKTFIDQFSLCDYWSVLKVSTCAAILQIARLATNYLRLHNGLGQRLPLIR